MPVSKLPARDISTPASIAPPGCALWPWALAWKQNCSGLHSLVEHTSINPNKAAHVGHLRNAILGDTFVRLLRAAGQKVDIQNYIDNTGVQVADVVVGFLHLEGKSLAEVRLLLDGLKQKGQRIDYYCWDLYAATSQWYTGGTDEENEAREACATPRCTRSSTAATKPPRWPS